MKDDCFKAIQKENIEFDEEESGRNHLLESFNELLDLYVKEGGNLYKTSLKEMIKWCYKKCGYNNVNEQVKAIKEEL